jgi:hypothetical protein
MPIIWNVPFQEGEIFPPVFPPLWGLDRFAGVSDLIAGCARGFGLFCVTPNVSERQYKNF